MQPPDSDCCFRQPKVLKSAEGTKRQRQRARRRGFYAASWIRRMVVSQSSPIVHTFHGRWPRVPSPDPVHHHIVFLQPATFDLPGHYSGLISCPPSCSSAIHPSFIRRFIHEFLSVLISTPYKFLDMADRLTDHCPPPLFPLNVTC
jgi:hypothetical protein